MPLCCHLAARLKANTHARKTLILERASASLWLLMIMKIKIKENNTGTKDATGRYSKCGQQGAVMLRAAVFSEDRAEQG